MIDNGVNWRRMTRRVAMLLVLPLALASAADAQSIMRTPSLNIPSRTPTINPTIAPRVNPNIAGRGPVGVNSVGIGRAPAGGNTISAIRAARPVGVGSSTPYLNYSTNLYPACEYANRGPDGECFDRPLKLVGSGGTAKQGGGAGSDSTAAAINLRAVQNEFVAEIDGAMSPADADALARGHGLERIASQNFPLIGGTVGLFKIIDRRPMDTVRREFAADTKVKSVQPNFRYVLQDQKRRWPKAMPRNTQLAKLRLPEAHTLAHGNNVIVAVIDSGIDVRHPELVEFESSPASMRWAARKARISTAPAIAGAIVAHKPG